MTTYYLIENPNRTLAQLRARRDVPSGVVILHSAESRADEIGPDHGAENVAAFIASRSTYGSYHTLADSDSILPLVPPWLTAYGDGTGSNDHAFHISGAFSVAQWAHLPTEWREGCVRNMARAAADYADWLEDKRGITIPARRITRAESDREVPGFITHGERDPGRRTDPGKGFPHDRFLELYTEARSPKPPPPPKPSRGEIVDELIPELRKLIRRLDEAEAVPDSFRESRLEAAEVALRDARRNLRRVKIINAEQIARANMKGKA